MTARLTEWGERRLRELAAEAVAENERQIAELEAERLELCAAIVRSNVPQPDLGARLLDVDLELLNLGGPDYVDDDRRRYPNAVGTIPRRP